MKSISTLLMVLTVVPIFSQRKPKIKGNKEVIEVRESLPPFSAIELNDDLKVYLSPGREEGYSLKADDNLVDVLKFKVNDGTLEISSFYKITGKKKLEITVHYVQLQKILLREGRIESKEQLRADVFDLQMEGSTKAELTVSADLISVSMAGNSSGSLNLQSDTLQIAAKDRVDVGIYAVSELNALQLSNTATVNLEGTTSVLNATLHENTNLKARKMEADQAGLYLDGSPNAKVFVKDLFSLSSSGSSKTYLSGAAKIEILEFLDTSQLHKEK